MNPENGKLYNTVSTTFEDEYIRTINAKYSIKMSPKSDDRYGDNITRIRNGKLGDTSRLSTEVTNGVSLNNHLHEHPPKAQRRKIDFNTQNATYQSALNLSRKRKLIDTEHYDPKSQRKRRKIESIAERLKAHSETITQNDVHALTGRTVKLRKNGDVPHLRKKNAGLEKIDRNCNIMRDQGRTNKDESLNQIDSKDVFTESLKDPSNTSPFRGKMSAFEISRLKGKQSVERRKSLEAATLRLSPRLNANVAADQRTEKRSARSLTPSLNEKSLARRAAITTVNLKKEKKRLTGRTKSLSAVSPSSIENQLVTTKIKSTSKRRSLRTRDKQTENDVKKSSKVNRQHSLRSNIGPEKPPSSQMSTFTRMNGSPKLKDLPDVLSLSYLSGISHNIQGSLFLTIPQGKHANSISGTQPTLPSMNSAALEEEALPCVHPVLRPSSLPFGNSGKQNNSDKDGESAIKLENSAIKSGEKLNCKVVKQTKTYLEEKETSKLSTLEQNCSKSITGTVLTAVNALEGRTSRRSSRSSTPNVSPIKTEVLTPRCTPCSTPNKSPPNGNEQISKGRKYLFAKSDDVIARWHDGLFYIGKILKIDEVNAKCLLRYEDNSLYWSLFKDIHRMVTEEEICCICFGETSEIPNEIVICDHCNQGYHQKCHAPFIDSTNVVDPDDEWFCRQCVFFLTVKMGGAVKEGSRADDMRKMKEVLPYKDCNLVKSFGFNLKYLEKKRAMLESLTWDAQHKNNIEQKYCYCGGPGIWYEKMLQCCRCKQWFHEACLQCTDFPILFGDSFFIFVCVQCNSGQEYIKRLVIEWADVIHIVMFNLALVKRRKYFDVVDEILPWVEENWNLLRIVDSESNQKEFDKKDFQDQTIKVLQDNKSRFCNASEIRKKHSLWGLRIRVPPPRIQVDLPLTDMLTNDIMKKLKIKGRRSKVFIPVECKSPVKHISDSPCRAGVANRNFSSSWNAKKDGTYDEVKEPSSAKFKWKSRKNLPLLDRLIPHNESNNHFTHPFKTEIEQALQWDQNTLRNKIWDSYCQSGQLSEGPFESLEIPPVLEKVEPVIPETSSSSPPMPVIQEKKQKRKSVVKIEKEDQNGSADQEEKDDKSACRRSSRKQSNPTAIPVLKTEIDVKKVKTADGNYFCAYDKFGVGQGFYISGSRTNPFGIVECFINWDY